MKDLKLTAEQQTFVDGLNKEEIEALNKLTDTDKVDFINLQMGLVTDVTTVTEGENAVEFETTGYKVDNAPILIPGGTGIVGLKAGSKIVAMFMGFDYIFSDEPKENWKEVKTRDGKETRFRSEYLRFRRTNGSEFGIFSTPMLKNNLRTLLTHSSASKLVSKDPVVEIEYHGKLKKEVLKKDFNFELRTGSEAHAFRVRKERGARENLEAGIHCLLSCPIPAAKSDRDDMTNEEAEMLSWENQNQANLIAGQKLAQLEENTVQ